MSVAASSLPRWTVALLVACAINALVFIGFPLLSGKVSSPPPRPELGGVFLTRFVPPPPPAPHLPDKPEPRPRVVNRPVLGRKTPDARSPLAVSMPKLRMRLPGDISLDVTLPELPAPSLAAFKSEYDLGEVDAVPVAVRRDAPVYPMAARRNGVEGVVTVRFLVGEDGVPRNLSIVESDSGGIFDKNVLRAVERWRFRPGMVNGRAVATWLRLPVRFRLEER